MEERKVRKAYEGTRFRTDVGSEPTVAKQSFADECDINKMIERHRRNGGVWDHLAKREPTYGDFSRAEDLHTAMNHVADAEAQFMELPSGVRALCENSAEELLRALADPERTAELVEAGLPMVDTYTAPEKEETKKTDDTGEETVELNAPGIQGGE